MNASTGDAENQDGTGSSDLDLGQKDVGLRFTGLTIPQGATITNAYVQFLAGETDSNSTSTTIRGHDTDDAETFTTSGPSNVTSHPTTSSSASWSPSAWTVGQSDAAQRTPDISAVIQEIVDRAGWVSGNDLALILLGGGGQRAAESYESIPASAPLLHVEYEQ